MKIAVTGASGLIGSALVRALRAGGHDVLRLVRRTPSAPDEVQWDPERAEVDVAALRGLDGLVHLAGAGVGDRRWTAAYKQTIRSSRVDGTWVVADALTRLDPLPRVMVSGSAIGWYGDTGDRAVEEGAPAGDDFLAQVCVDWEAATRPAEAAGIRVAHARTGLVLDRAGGALQRLLPIFRLGGGGRLGSGRQYWSWITLEDEVRALTFLLEADGVAGPVNLTAPTPVTNAEVTRTLARVVRRPALLPVPSAALKVALGDFSDDILGSQRVLPGVLQRSGFAFRHQEIEQGLRAAVTGPVASPR
jgi:hypothetical protein